MAEPLDRPFVFGVGLNVFGVDLDAKLILSCGNYNLALRDILAEKRGVLNG